MKKSKGLKMLKIRKTTIAILLWSLFFVLACSDSCDTPSAPNDGVGTGTLTTTTTPVIPPLPPRADNQPLPMGRSVIGFTAFSLVETYDAGAGLEDSAALQRQYIYQMLTYMRSKGFNVARVGAQTDGWCGSGAFYLVCGTAPYTPEWYENLRGFLAASSRVEGMSIQLIPTFTHKGDSGGTSALVDLTREVVRIVQEKNYKHVFYEAFNEFNHPITREAGNLRESVLKAVLRELPHPRGTDVPDNHLEGDRWRGNPDHSVVNGAIVLMDYIAYHPSRNPEPTARAYNRTIQLSKGKVVLFDETVSWITESEAGMLGSRRNSALFTQGNQQEMNRQVQNQVNIICGETNGGYFFHALWLFSYDERLGWTPDVGICG